MNINKYAEVCSSSVAWISCLLWLESYKVLALLSLSFLVHVLYSFTIISVYFVEFFLSIYSMFILVVSCFTPEKIKYQSCLYYNLRTEARKVWYALLVTNGRTSFDNHVLNNIKLTLTSVLWKRKDMPIHIH